MLPILKYLDHCKVVEKYEIMDYKQGASFYFLKLRIELSDETLLYVRKYVSSEDYNYSFQWQKNDGSLIIRWDNSPHHRNLNTFPHHQHIGNLIRPSKVMTLKDVLTIIENDAE